VVHLAAGHAEYGVVDEDHRDLLGAMGGVDDLGRPDRRKVAVTLIGEDDAVRVGAFHTGGDGGGPAVRDLDHVHVEIIVREHGASDRRDANCPAADVELVDHFGDEPMRDPVAAARTVVRRAILENLRSFE